MGFYYPDMDSTTQLHGDLFSVIPRIPKITNLRMMECQGSTVAVVEQLMEEMRRSPVDIMGT